MDLTLPVIKFQFPSAALTQNHSTVLLPVQRPATNDTNPLVVAPLFGSPIIEVLNRETLHSFTHPIESESLLIISWLFSLSLLNANHCWLSGKATL